MDKDGNVFEQYKNQPIAVYGLSLETEKFLVAYSSYNIIGLLDGFMTEGELYGMPILSLQEAVQAGVRLIVVVARPESCKVIAKRIQNVCRENDIALFDNRKNNLLKAEQAVYDFRKLQPVYKEVLLEEIRQAEVISFDLFDTLVMRNVLYFEDVVELAERRWKEKGVAIEDFKRRRYVAEKQLSQNSAPNLVQIYDLMFAEKKINVTSYELAEMEYAVDLELLVPRKEVVTLICVAKQLGKKVYITTDTYYSQEQILKILEENGIKQIDGVLASCEYNTGKIQDLFEVLIREAGTKNILHIGDNVVADVQSAERHGIKAFQIYSGRELLNALGDLGVSEFERNLSDRIKLGMFVAKIFNSPFVFDNDNSALAVTKAEDIGYLLCAPVISDFVMWLNRKVQEQKLGTILYGARDGYLLQKMNELLNPEQKTVYFLTSRTAAIRAGVATEEDIRYVDSMRYSGTLEENLLARFGIAAGDVTAAQEENSGLLKYAACILEKAKRERENYQKYIDNLNLIEEKMVFFDFVAKGTCQLFLQKIMKNPLKGFYFLQLEPGAMDKNDVEIESFFSLETDDSSGIFEDYYILETILTAPFPSVNGFDENGEPVYAVETRSPQEIRCFSKVQAGILEYFSTYLKLCPIAERTENKKMDEIFVKLFHHAKITEEAFAKLNVEDPFFNRTTSVAELL